jgi:hypothetical protein
MRASNRPRLTSADLEPVAPQNAANAEFDIVRIPTKPAMHSNMKPATYSNPKPAGVPI